MRFEGRNVLIFRFQNIHLPDSASNPGQSKGYVTFTIQRQPNLPVGTVIRNRAGIYFDYNAPVITNWVESVLSPPVGVAEVLPKFEITLFPNPNMGQFSVELPVPAPVKMVLKISDLAGRPVFEKQADAGSRRHTLRAESLPPGLYFLKVVSEGKALAVEKFVKE